MSGLVNKVKDALHSDKSSHHTEGTHSHTTGTTGTTGGLHESSHVTTGTREGAYGSSVDPNRDNFQRTDGPHGNLGNKLDPRVDSDRDHSRNMGLNPTGTASATTGRTEHSTLGSSTHEPSHTSYGTQEGAYGSSVDPNRNNLQRTDGPHGNLGNKLDPRVDSDRDHSRNLGMNPAGSADTTTGRTGGFNQGSHLGGTTGTTDTYGSSNTYGSSTGAGGLEQMTGPAPNTAGPHKSDMLNKVDPRVDSDIDGSKTYGGNKTFSQ